MKIRLAGAELFHADGRWEWRLIIVLAILRMLLKKLRVPAKSAISYIGYVKLVMNSSSTLAQCKNNFIRENQHTQ